MRKLFVIFVLAVVCAVSVWADDPTICPSYCLCGCGEYLPKTCSYCPSMCGATCMQQYTDCMAGAWTPEEVAACASERTDCRASCGA